MRFCFLFLFFLININGVASIDDILSIPLISENIVSFLDTEDRKNVSTVNTELYSICSEHARETLSNNIKDRIADSPFELHLKYAAISGNTWKDLKNNTLLFNNDNLGKFLPLMVGHSVHIDAKVKKIIEKSLKTQYKKYFGIDFSLGTSHLMKNIFIYHLCLKNQSTKQ